MEQHTDIFFDYINETSVTNVSQILSSLFINTNIPECIVKEIETFLFLDHYHNVRFIYESKCEEYIRTKDTYYKSLYLNKYDFIFQIIKTMMFKFLTQSDSFILPYLRRDIHLLTNCHLNSTTFIINNDFITRNKYLILSLFVELCSDFQHRSTYFCIYTNNEKSMNAKYYTFLEKIFIL
jgi:hypothetical protein